MSKVTSTVVGTWAFSAEPVHVAGSLVALGRHCIECIEKAINVAEEEESYGPCIVGCGGGRNAKGELELDAAIMDGRDLSFGAVTALQGIRRPISVARCVMEKSPHSMLTGSGAIDFAIECGFHLDTSLLHAPVLTSADMTKEDNQLQHDTLGLIVLDKDGNIGAGVSTSGMVGKAPGRVGDSALPGSGIYADNEVGAACCSGDGDHILKFCPSFLVVEFMRQGLKPEDACKVAVQRIIQHSGFTKAFEISLIAVDVKGNVGAATTVEVSRDGKSGQMYPGFPYVVWTDKDGSRHSEIRVVGRLSQ